MPINSVANDTVTKNQVLHGARAYITIDGEPIGYVSNLTGGEEYQMDPVEVLDSLVPAEFVPTAYRIRLSARTVMLTNVSYKDQKLFDSVANVLSAPGLTLIVVDNVSGQPIISFNGVRGQATNFSIEKGQITMNDVTFVAISSADLNQTI
tara:strand:+ start:833 stop:1285 length:453 start_codon:yes stop_codon:yes gene_type:complete